MAAENTGPGPRKRPGYRRLPPGQRREEIIAAAIATFSADHDASLGDVAATEPSNGPLSVHLRCLAGAFNTGLFSSIARLLIEDRS